MSSLLSLSSSTTWNVLQKTFSRSLATPARSPKPKTHYKITLTRSAIALGEKKQETLVSLGLHRRMQTVYHPHTPEAAGKILKVKELVEVTNVPASTVRTQTEQRRERKASRGYAVAGTQMKRLPWERAQV
ncbi:hypothetical protein F5I97DRAFT_1892896 [Phlebopus sp. FC_14]|nr:hypothetical protein F5I97DRAFT_1892896 [Phlebopus sp. FC_14]